jgi:dTDP-glucose pyrophosphorylase
MKLLVPLAGGDQAFLEQGYQYCKALSEIQGRPMIEHVWSCLREIQADQHIFVVRKEDCKRFFLDDVLKLLDPDAVVIQADGMTAGAACTSLLAAGHIDCDDELVIANGDQLFSVSLAHAIGDFRQRSLDGGTVVFDSVHPRWSFVRLDGDGLVVEAAEKRPISRYATAGFYYFRRGADFVTAAKSMIVKGAEVGGSYYVCPSFNEMILKQSRIGVFEVPRDAYISLATPQSVKDYEQRLLRGERRRST